MNTTRFQLATTLFCLVGAASSVPAQTGGGLAYPDLVAFRGEWVGTISSSVADDFQQHRSTTRWTLESGGRSYDLPNGQFGSWVGKRVRIGGVARGNALSVERVEKLPEAAAPSQCGTTGDQKIAVLMVTTPSHRTFPPLFTAATLQQAFFGSPSDTSSTASLNGMWKEMSYGATSASGQVFGPFALSRDYTYDIESQLKTDTIAAADATVDFRSFSRIAIVFPLDNSSQWAVGADSTIGCIPVVSPSKGALTASLAVLPAFGDLAVVPVFAYAHELGHSLGLGHASSDDYGSQTLGPLATPGTLSEYGDAFSFMGSYGQYDAPHKSLILNWLQPGGYLEVSSPGTFVVAPYESSSGVRALRVLRDAGTGARIWIEYRQPVGDIDKNLVSYNTNPYAGALIHYEDPNLDSPQHTYLLDFTPKGTPNDFKDAVFVPGKTWTDPYSPLSLTVNSATPQGLSITVAYSKLLQSITFAPLAVAALGAGPIPVKAAASSGLPVILASATPLVCSVAGVTVTLLATGTCTVTATQPGNNDYSAAAAISQSFTVAQSANAPITIYSNLGSGSTVYGGSNSHIINSLTGGASFTGLFEFAAAFTPQGTAWLSELDLAVGLSAAKGSLVVNLMSDSNGPASVLESWTLGTNLPVSFGCCTLQKLIPATALQLTGGTRYWIAVLPGPNTWGWWASDTAGSSDTAGKDYTMQVNSGSGWIPVATTESAFAVWGTASAPLLPTIDNNGVVPSSSTIPVISPGEWVTIYGNNLASQTLQWSGDFPVSLGGTSVMIDGKPAYLSYVSPRQINLQVPDGIGRGSLAVVVSNGSGSISANVTVVDAAPSLFLLDGTHVAGVIPRADGSGAYNGGSFDLVGPTGNSLGYPTVAAKPGDTILLYGTGFGATIPAVPAGRPFSGAAPALNPLTVRFGNVDVTPDFAGLSGAGLFQINVTVPPNAGRGDVPLQVSGGGSVAQPGVVISLQ